MKNNKKSTKNNKTKKLANKIVSENKNSKVIKINYDLNKKNLVSSKKLKVTLAVILIIFVLLIFRIGWLQFADGTKLTELANAQQTLNQIISPKRGNIYDSTGQTLATSEQVDTITINPTKIKGKTDDETLAKKALVAKGLSDIFSLDYDEVYTKVTSTSSVETIIKKVEQDKVNELTTWMTDNKITVGINIDEDTKRFYPYGTLAAHVIGFCGSDNDGRSGIEYKWNSILSGTSGKLVSSKDSSQSEIPNTEQTYIAAEDGSNITLTIDMKIQSIVEKYLEQAVKDNSCERGGNCIVMNPNTGDILAMATYPTYDLNDPFTPNSTLAATWDSLTSEQKSTSLYSMWSNKSVSETYEPGSTFKVLTATVALEEDITGTDVENDFFCPGYHIVNGVRVSCWKTDGSHGYQTLRKALQNSCNPAFMQLGARIGASTLYKYYKAFGLFDRTGIALPGESNSIFHDLDTIRPIEVATMSFGQRFTITPLQLVTAVSAVANGGTLMQPRIVKEITNSSTGAVTTTDIVSVRQVISKETSEQVKSLMESVVTKGTGGHAAVSGYSIGGKTGTSEPTVGNEEAGYVASYVAISPVENTEVVLLLTLYKPTGAAGHQGGTIAGPVVSQMLSEILPYLGIVSDKEQLQETTATQITVPDISNKTLTEAKKVLTDAGLTVKINSDGDQNALLVSDQVPKPGTKLTSGGIVVLYSENTIRTSVSVPNLKGMSAAQATNSLHAQHLNIEISGTSGTVISQDYLSGATIEAGTVVKVTIKENLASGGQ